MATPRSSTLSNDTKWRLKVALAKPDAGQEVIDKLDDLRYADVTISAAAMDTLNATPVTLVAAPGTGKMIEFLGASVINTFLTTAFELGSGTVDIRYENSSGGLAGQLTNAFVESSATAYFRAAPLACVALTNKALVAYASADVTAGLGNLKFRVYYRVLTVADVTA
jgi:hypothetical protein